jgi:hypothetical protein
MLACGEDEAGPPDAPAPADDAAADAPSVTDGLAPDLGACDADQACPDGTDCVRVAWLGGALRCLRPCLATADCGLDEVCYAGVADPVFAAMANHCYTSICTAPLAACQLGAEIGLPAADQRAGTCVPVDDEGAAGDGGPGPIGQCHEAGSLGEGQPCLRKVAGGPRDVPLCAQGLVCGGDAGDATGLCARLCDPLASPDPCTAPATACFDASTGQTVRDPQSGQIEALLHATWGFCRPGQRCNLLVQGSCPSGRGCLPTTPVRPSGFCSEQGTGQRPLGQPCVPFGVLAPAPSERCQEALCDPDFPGALTGTCRAYCDPGHACGVGSCEPYLWVEDDAGMPNLTQAFGVCR